MNTDAEAACTRLCVGFANHIDARRYDDLVDLFLPEGTLDRAGNVVHGHIGIRRFLDARPATVMTRHLCTNVQITLQSDSEATGFSCALFFRAEPAADAALPVQADPPSVVEYHDRYVRTEAGWKIAHRRIQPVFTA